MENSLSDAHVTHDQVGGICIAVFQCDTSGNLILHIDALDSRVERYRPAPYVFV